MTPVTAPDGIPLVKKLPLATFGQEDVIGIADHIVDC
jgi:hypothetical protein